MSSRPRVWPPIAVTGSRFLRAELSLCALHAGTEFEYTESIPHGRAYAGRRPLIIVGVDLAARVRKPLRCGGLVVVAAVDPHNERTFLHAGRIGAAYVIALPTARPWLVDQLLRTA
jgi:hypothetical protein